MQKQPFSCQRDGLTIRGHIFGSTEPGQHVVIISHGFLANEKSVRTYAEALAEAGYTALTYDFNGGGLGSTSDGKSGDMTVLTERADLISVIGAVREQLKPAAISLWGCSQGGFVSGLTAKKLGAEAIRSLIMFYPALCIPDDARRGQMIMYRFDPANIPEVLGHLPMKLGGVYARAVVDMDPYAEIGGYTGPVLLVHGTADDLVRVNYSRRAREVYPDCEYHELEGAGHGFAGADDQQAIAWVLAHLSSLRG